MWVFKCLSALLFLIGWTALLVAGVGAWFYVVVYAAMSVGWFVAFVLFVGSVAAFFYCEKFIRAPFMFWLRAWQYADRMICDRHR